MISCPFSTNFYKQFPFFFFLKKKKGSKTNNNNPKDTAPKGDSEQAAFPQHCGARSFGLCPAGLRLNSELGLGAD